MPRTTPYLKGLAETRARAEADYQSALESAAHRTAHLQRLFANFESKSTDVRKSIERSRAQAEAALQAREACDCLIRKLNQGFAPTSIEPVDGWQGRYGRRGNLARAIQAIVEAHYPAFVTTLFISDVIQSQHGLAFATPAERKKWVGNSIRTRLKYLCHQGLVERLHNPRACGNATVGKWRAIPPDSVCADIRALANQAGVPLSFLSAGEDAFLPEISEDDDLPR